MEMSSELMFQPFYFNRKDSSHSHRIEQGWESDGFGHGDEENDAGIYLE
jgi:hypothetical protein